MSDREQTTSVLSAETLRELESLGLTVVAKDSEDGTQEQNGQLGFNDLEPAMELIQFAEETIRDYNWMMDEIKRTESQLVDAGEGTIGSYGDPNAGIRAQYKNSDKTGAEVARRSRDWQRLNRMKERVRFFDTAMKTITDEQERMIMEYLIDRVPMKDIGFFLGISRQRVQQIKQSMIRKLAWALKESGGAARW